MSTRKLSLKSSSREVKNKFCHLPKTSLKEIYKIQEDHGVSTYSLEDDTVKKEIHYSTAKKGEMTSPLSFQTSTIVKGASACKEKVERTRKEMSVLFEIPG